MRLDIREMEYLQVLTGDNAVLEWIRGSALAPVRETLPADEYADSLVAMAMLCAMHIRAAQTVRRCFRSTACSSLRAAIAEDDRSDHFVADVRRW